MFNLKDSMPEEVVYYVTRYGYLAIFILVFLQETGMPNPFPNEVLLIFSGYLSFKGCLLLLSQDSRGRQERVQKLN